MTVDTAPADLCGAAYGFFNLASGLVMLVASALAGLLGDGLGAAFTFVVRAIFAAALALPLLLRPA